MVLNLDLLYKVISFDIELNKNLNCSIFNSVKLENIFGVLESLLKVKVIIYYKNFLINNYLSRNLGKRNGFIIQSIKTYYFLLCKSFNFLM